MDIHVSKPLTQTTYMDIHISKPLTQTTYMDIHEGPESLQCGVAVSVFVLFWLNLTNTESETESETNTNSNLMMRRAGLSRVAFYFYQCSERLRHELRWSWFHISYLEYSQKSQKEGMVQNEEKTM